MSVILDVGVSAREGLPGGLVTALEYGHPAGVPALSVWRRTVREMDRRVGKLGAELIEHENRALSQGGPRRIVAVS